MDAPSNRTRANKLNWALLSPVLAVIPVFGLILAGWLVGRNGIMGPHASDGLNGFVVWLALPALLFNIIATSKWAHLWQPGFIAVFGLSGLITMTVAVAVLFFYKRRCLADAAIEGLNAGYPNVGFMGFPLVLAVLGQEALVPTTIAAVMSTGLFFTGTVILVEIGLQNGKNPFQLAWKVIRSLVRNPLVMAPICGIPFSCFEIEIPAPAQDFLRILAGAASPCALVALGLFLVNMQKIPSTKSTNTAFLVACKLLLQPALAWLTASKIVGLEPKLVQSAILLAALPAGTGSLMLASYYKREAKISSKVILLSTLLSVLSIAFVIAVFR